MNAALDRQTRGEPTVPWSRQPKETAKAYAAFVVYRDMPPPRSIRGLARSLDRGVRVLEAWSSKYKWVERADAWTLHLDELSRAATEEEIVRRKREEAAALYNIGKDAQVAAHARIVGVKDDAGKVLVEGIDPNMLDADDVIRWAEFGTKSIRLSLGLPTDLSGNITVNLNDVKKMLDSFLALAEKRMDEAAFEALVRDCYAMVRETLGG